MRQDVTERDDRGIELGLRLSHRRFLLDSEAKQSAPWATATISLEAAYGFWELPHNAVADWVAPLFSDRERHSVHLLLATRFSYERFNL